LLLPSSLLLPVLQPALQEQCGPAAQQVLLLLPLAQLQGCSAAAAAVVAVVLQLAARAAVSPCVVEEQPCCRHCCLTAAQQQLPQGRQPQLPRALSQHLLLQ
jgi:hypothetical protein